MYPTAQQYDDSPWQVPPVESSQSGTESMPGWWDPFDPQLFAECASVDTFAASQPLQPSDYEAPLYAPTDM